jgi:hypothetical protein
LNAKRAEEEKRGLIRWLRPEYQQKVVKVKGPAVEPTPEPSPQPSPGGRGRRTDGACLPFSSREKGPGDEGQPATKGPGDEGQPATKGPGDEGQPATKGPGDEGQPATKGPGGEGQPATKGPGDEGQPATRGRPRRAKAGSPKPPWPKTLPEQIGAVRDLVLGSERAWTAEAVARSFHRAQVKTVEPVLDSLSAIGVLVALDGEGGRQWKGAGK